MGITAAYVKCNHFEKNMKNKSLSVSVVITTYNRPDALKIVLQSLLQQSVQPAEIIIADDGSTIETKNLIEEMTPLFAIPVCHCWQEDEGFRASASRNKAIAKSKSDYIIIIDGDILLHRHFVRDHIFSAQKGQFVQGRRVLLLEELTSEILLRQKTQLTPFSKGIKNRLNACCSRLLSPLLSSLLSKQNHMSVRSCNMAFWKTDVIAINGFNEEFVGWGREDSEFAVRMFNNKIKRRDLRLGGVAYHLFHLENSKKMLENNDCLLQQTVNERSKFCKIGINKYL